MALAPAADAPATPDFYSDLWSFHKHYSVFVDRLYGCPQKWVTVAECRPNLGHFDLREHRQASKYAKRIFQ